MEAPSHVHRANTFLKQANKPFKTGRVGKDSTRAQLKAHSELEGQKKNLKNARKLAQQNKKEDLVRRRRGLGAKNGPPRIVGIVLLSADIPAKSSRTFLLQHTGGEVALDATTISVPAVKTRFCIFEPARTMDAVLDIAKVADVILFMASAEQGVDEIGKMFISCIKAQGTPAIVGAIAARPATTLPQRTEARKTFTKWMHMQFPDEPKVLPLDSAPDAGQVYRFLANARPHELRWREQRPYLLVERFSAVPDTNHVCGFLRGSSLSANQLVHLTGIGDFQLECVEGLDDPTLPKRPAKSAMDATSAGAADSAAAASAVDTPDDKQEQLISENVPDPMANEQNFGEEEEAPAMEIIRKKKVPKGTSEYQAHWILDSEDEDESEHSEFDSDAEVDKWGNFIEKMDGGDKKEKKARSKKVVEDEEMEPEPEPKSVAPPRAEDIAANHEIEMAEEVGHGRSKKERAAEAAKDDLQWPDEVETPMEQPAHVRFGRYRGLASFRTSPWDPYENLPRDYARIFQFENFTRTSRRVKADADANPIESGQWIRLTIRNFPAALLASFPFTETPLLVWGLLKYEQCMSVIHFAIRRHATYAEPVTSKEELIFHSGFRRYVATPIFSQHNPNCDKHKFERFLHEKRPVVASVLAPITYTPAPLLVYSCPTPTQPVSRLVATGALLSVDPNRIILKKIVLTGFPFKIHKRTAVVRDMFFHPDDINWFKPVELYTRRGRTGHIIESLGTHGHMKVQMDGGLASDETVCMNLYKRVYPKWNTKFLVFANQPTERPAPFAPPPK